MRPRSTARVRPVRRILNLEQLESHDPPSSLFVGDFFQAPAFGPSDSSATRNLTGPATSEVRLLNLGLSDGVDSFHRANSWYEDPRPTFTTQSTTTQQS